MRGMALSALGAVLLLPVAVSGAKPKQGRDGKVTICHIPPGNPANAHTIRVSHNAVRAHLKHGDKLGPCPRPTPSPTTSPTATPSPSPTATPTASPTVTPSPTATATPTPKPCKHPWKCPQPTPTATPTATPTPIATPTAPPVPLQQPVGPSGPAGPQGPPGSAGEDGDDGRPRTCVSKRIVTITLPNSYSGVKRVGALVSGKLRVLRVNNRRQVRISFVGRQRAGINAVVIRRKPRPEIKRFYALCGQGAVGGVNVPPRPTPSN